MAFIPVPDAVECVLRFIWAGQVVSITLSFRKLGGFTTTDQSNLVTALRTWHGASLKAQQSSLISLTNVACMDLRTATGPVIEQVVSPVVPGTNGSSSVFNNVTLASSFITDSRGRSYRGRVFTPGLSQSGVVSSVDAGLTNAAALTAVYAALNAAVVSATFIHVVVSRFTAGAPRVTGISTAVTAYRTEQYFDSQRRRLYGRGI